MDILETYKFLERLAKAADEPDKRKARKKLVRLYMEIHEDKSCPQDDRKAKAELVLEQILYLAKEG